MSVTTIDTCNSQGTARGPETPTTSHLADRNLNGSVKRQSWMGPATTHLPTPGCALSALLDVCNSLQTRTAKPTQKSVKANKCVD
jgi:hypothetical protein